MQSSFWSQQEIKMVNVMDVFQQKPAIMKKAESHLMELKAALVEEAAAAKKLFPPGTDIAKGQVARGENHEGFPFISMDMPQKFSKIEMFTYRTLFWWGHYLGFSFILKGEALPGYLDRIAAAKSCPASENIFFACHESPWEWGWSEENFKNLAKTSEEEIRQIISNIQYIKLCRVYPLNEPAFAGLDWVSAGLETYRNMTQLFLPQE